jgi:catechol 2,3-dioxygenase-like lactoylglutathione lyase family enzyme
MNPTLPHLVRGADHVAYPTFDPEGTVRFYHEVLGFPIVHAILAKGWGREYNPDFVHFFFDVGDGDRIAFFYYFGLEPYRDETPKLLRHTSRHLAIHVDSLQALEEYQRRLDASEWPVFMRVPHETIESIYVYDPNDYLIEFTTPTRPAVPADARDAELTVAALVDVVRKESEPSLAAVCARKAELIGGGEVQR